MSNPLKNPSTGDNSGRYITLSGDPIHTSLTSSFLQATDTKAGVIASLGHGLLFHRDESFFFDFFASLVGNILISGMGRYFSAEAMERRFNKADICIDTLPDGKTPPTSPENISLALSLKNYFFLNIAAYTFVTTISTAANNIGSSDAIPYLPTNFTGIMAQYISGYNRFNKVAKGEWVIVDTPPPERARELVPAHIPV